MQETLDQIKQRIAQLEKVVEVAEDNEYADASRIPDVHRLLRRALFVLGETDDLIFAILKPTTGRRRTCSNSNLKETN